MSHELVLLSGNSSPLLANQISKLLGRKPCNAVISKNVTGELEVNILESVRACDVFIIQPTLPNPNDSLMELLILTDAVKRASAARITGVIPCFGYARQDKKDKARVSIPAKLVANMIQVSGIDRILTMNLHSTRMQGFFNIPVDNLFAIQLFKSHLNKFITEDKVVVSVGVGGVHRTKRLADEINSSLAIVHFGKLIPGDLRDESGVSIEDMKLVGDVKGKTAILYEDIADTCELLVLITQLLIQQGASKVYALATHGILSGNALQLVNQSELTELIITNTIQVPESARKECKKLRVINVASVLAEAIRRIHNGESLEKFFTEDWILFSQDHLEYC